MSVPGTHGSDPGATPMAPDVSIVIVSYNTRDILRSCLQAVQDHCASLCHEVFVIDNASRDGSVAMVAAEFPQVRLIANPGNRMFAGASNQGLALAAGRCLLLLNSDAYVGAGSVQRLVRFLDANPRAAAVGPKVLNLDGSLQSKGFAAPRIGLGLLRVTGLNKLLPQPLKERYFARYFWPEDRATMPDVLSGCCMMLSADVVRKIGALCEDFYHGGEDGEWCFRARRAGYQVWYCPESVVAHIGGASKVRLDDSITLRDTLRAWETSLGVGYGMVAEVLTTVYNAQRLAAARLRGRDAAARATIAHEVRLGGRKIAALARRWWRGPPAPPRPAP